MVNKKHSVGAHYGTRDWLMQRVASIVMATYAVALAVLAFTSAPGYAGWSGIFSNQFMKLATFVALISLFLHVWVGVRDILMDYIKPTGIRLLLLVLTIVALIAYVGWSIHILWGMK
jgi:succinate dehydrogenase / fumarate reductase, membrane anchor subunit